MQIYNKTAHMAYFYAIYDGQQGGRGVGSGGPPVTETDCSP